MILDVEKISNACLYCAIAGTIVFLLKTSIPLDTGSEVSSDFTSVADSDASFNFFTIESVAAFFMCFGWMCWTNLAFLHNGLKIALLISILTGAVGMFGFSFLISTFKKLEHVPKADLKELINKKGKAYLRFPKKGSGKITIEFNSKIQTLDAVNETEEEIQSFEQIEVIRVENDTIYIKKV